MDSNDDLIAVTGMSCRLPKGETTQAFWETLRKGRECVTFFEPDDLEPFWANKVGDRTSEFVLAAAILDDIEGFDPAFFGMTEEDARMTDPQHRLFLECAWEALENAAWGDTDAFSGAISVYAGSWMSSYASRLQGRAEGQRAEFSVWSGNGVDFLPTVSSYRLRLSGESVAVQSACSTSMMAVHLACESLLNGRSDMALAGGAAVDPIQAVGYRFEEGGLLSPDGHTRAFDADAAGTIRGHGVGVVVLRRLSDAIADGDPIHAVLRATAATNDGQRKVGFSAMSVEGIADAAATALAIADVDPETIEYVEMHGGATSGGDAIEFKAVERAYGKARTTPCGIGSVKSNMGDLIQAAGIAGFIKTVLCVEHGVIAPTINYDAPNPGMEMEGTNYYVASKATPFRNTPRRAGVSSCGVGGTNVHAVLEQAPARESQERAGPHLICLSARSEAALDAAKAELADHLDGPAPASLTQLQATLRRGRKAFSHRFAWVGASADALQRALRGETTEGVHHGVRTGEAARARVEVPAVPTHGAWLDVARAWVCGSTLVWSNTTDDGVVRVALPTYPFERRPYIVPLDEDCDGPTPAFACWAGTPVS